MYLTSVLKGTLTLESSNKVSSMALEYCREPAAKHMKDSSAAAREKVGNA